ncbi:MAG: helix-turn-helix transcriptional regulator [Bifidobacteriaceae bacterium]|jgi:transcriptional regulator with XRE-family HTH domain|nr:helix-turn-helix transcriptional regulator [Bifidobacteriaceae bacterium]
MSQYGKQFEKALAAELRAEKARRNITEYDIAQQLGIHRVSVSRYFSGARSIPLATFADLCRTLDLDTLEIVSKAEVAAKKELKRQAADPSSSEGTQQGA